VKKPIDSKWIIVDSPGWIEYLADGPKAGGYACYLESPQKLLLPPVVVFEVHRKLIHERGKNLADLFLSQAYGFSERLIALDLPLSILASRISIEYQLPMADSIIYATSRIHDAPLITSDEHFSGLPGVVLI
jgi:predicted nucleic acid-binding protein